jgi:prephenate dehydrogenase
MARIAIIGTGLIGTSMGLALRHSGIKDLHVVGTDYDNSAKAGAQKSGGFHRIENRLASAIQDADIVMLATPVMAMKDLMEAIGPQLPEGCVVTDVGSTKKEVLDWAEAILPRNVPFVGGHPMAGKETSGPANADANLFRGKPYCIIPGSRAGQQSVSVVTTIAEAIGANPFFIGLHEHDSFVAAVSHLPFILSVALVGCTSKSANWGDIAQLASTGYRDLTRLASGDPIMHRDICVSNPEPIVAWIDAFIRELYDMRKVLTGEDGSLNGDAVQQMFEQAFLAREQWLAGSVSSMNQGVNSISQIPSFAENMGQMLIGTKLMEKQKELFGRGREEGRKKK